MKIGACVKINLDGDKVSRKSLVLEKKDGFSYLEWLIRRLKKIKQLEIILSAAPKDNCDELFQIAKKHNLSLFFDPEVDRHQRLLNILAEFNFDAMLDIPAIFTCLGIHHTREMIEHHLAENADLTLPINFPNGSVPLAIVSRKSLEGIVEAGHELPYYQDVDSLPQDLKIADYELKGRRTFFETRLVLFSVKDQNRINYLLDKNPASTEEEKALYDELNVEDKYELMFEPAKRCLIEPTNHCNLRCTCCPHGMNTMTRARGFMSLDNFKRCIDHLPVDIGMSLFGYGESFVNKEIYKMINYCGDRSVNISTNGHFFHSKKNKLQLVNSSLDMLVFAIDGASEETYSKYRKRGMFTRIIKDIRELISLRNSLGKKKPVFEMQFILFDFNEHEIEDAKALANDLGMDRIYFKTTLGEQRGKTIVRKRKDRQLAFTNVEPLVNPFSRCLRPMIAWNGDYSPCCYFFNGSLVLGNLVRQSIDEIKQSSKFKEFAHRRVALDENNCANRNCYCYS